MNNIIWCALLAAACLLGACTPAEAVVYDIADGSGTKTGIERALPGETGATSEEANVPEEAPEVPGTIWIYICGAVEHPDVYELPEGSRVYEAVAAAGGMTDAADARALNLAEVLADGQQIVVFTAEEVAGGEAVPAGSASGTAAAKVDLNRAGKEDLLRLPGIGEVKADSILTYRNEHGKFTSIEEICNVSGIGEKSFEQLRDLIKV